jgi:hypothetical protein
MLGTVIPKKEKRRRNYSWEVLRFKILPEKNEEGQKRGTIFL